MIFRSHRIAAAILAAAAMLSSSGAEVAIRFSENVEVSGLNPSALQTLRRGNWPLPKWQRLLSVYAEQGSLLADLNLPPMAGSYSIEGQKLVFKPQFPFQAGVRYRASFRSQEVEGGRAAITTELYHFDPPPAKSATTVIAIHPSAGELPENVLKFYLQFSGPMNGGHIYDHIHLRDASGQEVELPFLEIDEELWDPAMTRLTLFLDPGRIKRGVKPLEEIGPALVAGKSFTLEINQAWRDAAGQPLKAGFEKKFKVIDPDRTPPDQTRWKIEPPKSKSRAALKVTFDEPIDHALAQRVLRITSPSGAAVRGSVKLNPDDTVWSFTPSEPWRAGDHQLLIPTMIEDLAGNNIGKPFDVDLEERPRPATTDLVRLPFTIR